MTVNWELGGCKGVLDKSRLRINKRKAGGGGQGDGGAGSEKSQSTYFEELPLEEQNQ